MYSVVAVGISLPAIICAATPAIMIGSYSVSKPTSASVVASLDTSPNFFLNVQCTDTPDCIPENCTTLPLAVTDVGTSISSTATPLNCTDVSLPLDSVVYCDTALSGATILLSSLPVRATYPLPLSIVCTSTAYSVGYKFSIWSLTALKTLSLIKGGLIFTRSPCACVAAVVPLAPLTTVNVSSAVLSDKLSLILDLFL